MVPTERRRIQPVMISLITTAMIMMIAILREIAMTIYENLMNMIINTPLVSVVFTVLITDLVSSIRYT